MVNILDENMWKCIIVLYTWKLPTENYFMSKENTSFLGTMSFPILSGSLRKSVKKIDIYVVTSDTLWHTYEMSPQF